MTIPLERMKLPEQRKWVQELEALGYDTLWSSEARTLDGFVPLALASEWAPSMRLGCACFPVQTRGPSTLAMGTAAMANAAPGRFVMGIGASSPPIVEWWNARTFEKPYQTVRDTLRFLQRALAGEYIHEKFESFELKHYKLGAKVDVQPPILVAALREQMLRLGAREADGVMLNMVSAHDLKKIVPIVREYGDDKEIAVRLCVTPTDDPEQARDIARRFAVNYMTSPAYLAQQEWLGHTEELVEMKAAAAKGDIKAALEALPDSVVKKHWHWGTAEACRATIAEYFELGADSVILAFLEEMADPYDVARSLAPRTAS